MIKTVAESLNEMKKDAGLSNRKLAELSGVPEGTVNKILSGNTANPSLDSVEAMVRAMGRSMDEIFGEPETPEQIQTAVIDHYAMLIDSYKEQITHYKDRIAELNGSFKAQVDGYKEQLVSQRRILWVLFGVIVVMMVFLSYLCVDVLHGDWGIIQYPR